MDMILLIWQQEQIQEDKNGDVQDATIKIASQMYLSQKVYFYYNCNPNIPVQCEP